MHIPRKNDQYFYFSDVPDVRSKRFWTDTTSSFGRWPKTLQLCPALVAFQKSTFETSATRLLSQPFSPRRCLDTFFSARSPICVKLSRCTIILLKLQTSNWAHSCLEHTPFRGATKTNQPPRAPLVEEAVPKVCRKLTVPSCFFRSCKLPLKILQSRLHIIRTSYQNVKPLCLRRLGLFIIHRMKRVKSFQPHSGFGVSTFFESHGPLIGWYAFKRSALNSLRFLSSVHPIYFVQQFDSLHHFLQKLLHQQIVHRVFKIATQVYKVVLCGNDAYILPISNWLLEIRRPAAHGPQTQQMAVFDRSQSINYVRCCRLLAVSALLPFVLADFFLTQPRSKVCRSVALIFFRPRVVERESKMCSFFCARGLRTSDAIPEATRAEKFTLDSLSTIVSF